MGFYKKICQHCKGTGIYIKHTSEGDVSVNPCPYCGGIGYLAEGLTTPPENIFESYLVLECLNATEYTALTDTQKDGVLQLLACGKVDLNTGKVGRVRLWNWFGVESTTVANLTALLE